MPTSTDTTSTELPPSPEAASRRHRPRLLTLLVPVCSAVVMIGAMGTWTENAAGKPLVEGRDSGIGWMTFVLGLAALILSLLAVLRHRDRWLLPAMFVLLVAALIVVGVALAMTDGTQTTGSGVATVVIAAFLGVSLSTLQLLLRLTIGLTRRIIRTVRASA